MSHFTVIIFVHGLMAQVLGFLGRVAFKHKKLCKYVQCGCIS